MSTQSRTHHMHRHGHWLPQDHAVLEAWLRDTISAADAQAEQQRHPSIEAFQQAIETDTRLRMLVESMLNQVPVTKPYRTDPAGHPQLRDYHQMLSVMNYLLTSAPAWTHQDRVAGVVGLPFTAMFDWPMATTAGYSFFLDPIVNKHLKAILDAWGSFLQSPPSAKVLSSDKSAWLGPEGKKQLTEVANQAVGSNHSFEDMFICDSAKDYHGFKSWDDFFTRLFRDGIRPVASPENDNVIANACESKTYRVAQSVKRTDEFWVKGQPYSVVDMLAHDPLAEQFVGGTVYQAFLSALSYHRWHAPVSGKVVKAYVVQGTYYSEPLCEGFEGEGPDTSGEGSSQAYLTEVATRSFIYIQADNPKIGLICVMPVGMVEVSTCDITVKEGQRVEKGDQLGMFHFGGSTHCMFFRKGVEVSGFPQPGGEANVPVRSQLAVVR